MQTQAKNGNITWIYSLLSTWNFWQSYIRSVEFLVRTYHMSYSKIKSQQNLLTQQSRWLKIKLVSLRGYLFLRWVAQGCWAKFWTCKPRKMELPKLPYQLDLKNLTHNVETGKTMTTYHKLWNIITLIWTGDSAFNVH